MMQYRLHDTRSRARHHGAALVVALILLLVMTILGVTAMNSSILQGFMSNAFQQQTRTLALAENTLREGELDVENLVISGVNPAGGPDRSDYYVNLVANPGSVFDAADYGTAWPATNYYIEYLGRRIVPGESVAIGGGLEDSLVHVFRVSARETRPDDERGGIRIVQSLYLTLDGPDE
jgi:type IV pilus assembly protein PilX